MTNRFTFLSGPFAKESGKNPTENLVQKLPAEEKTNNKNTAEKPWQQPRYAQQ